MPRVKYRSLKERQEAKRKQTQVSHQLKLDGELYEKLCTMYPEYEPLLDSWLEAVEKQRYFKKALDNALYDTGMKVSYKSCSPGNKTKHEVTIYKDEEPTYTVEELTQSLTSMPIDELIEVRPERTGNPALYWKIRKEREATEGDSYKRMVRRIQEERARLEEEARNNADEKDGHN